MSGHSIGVLLCCLALDCVMSFPEIGPKIVNGGSWSFPTAYTCVKGKSAGGAERYENSMNSVFLGALSGRGGQRQLRCGSS